MELEVLYTRTCSAICAKCYRLVWHTRSSLQVQFFIVSYQVTYFFFVF
jgi:hypothetical protein